MSTISTVNFKMVVLSISVSLFYSIGNDWLERLMYKNQIRFPIYEHFGSDELMVLKLRLKGKESIMYRGL